MARRVPFPWESRPVERVELDEVPPRPPGTCGVPGAEHLAGVVAGDPDANRTRRGAEGAADAMYRESVARGWGLSRDQCRDRVNLARGRAAAKRRR